MTEFRVVVPHNSCPVVNKTAACGVTVTHLECLPASHHVPGSCVTSDLPVGEMQQKRFLSGRRAGRLSADLPL